MIPTSRYLIKKKHKSRGICTQCRKDYSIRNLVYFKGQYLCSNCKPKMNIEGYFIKDTYLIKRLRKLGFNLTIDLRRIINKVKEKRDAIETMS